MLNAIAIIPSAPVLVPELAGATVQQVPELIEPRAAVVSVVAGLPARWVVIGTGRADAVIGAGGAQGTGTFAGYGRDVRVALTPAATGPLQRWPLCALIAGWARGQANPDAHAEVRVFAADQDAQTAMARGRALRAEIDAAADPVGVLVVADGAHTLTAGAPGGFRPDASAAQQQLDEALRSGDTDALSRLPAEITGRVAYQVLAGLAEPASTRELYCAAPFGVGYFVGVWQP